MGGMIRDIFQSGESWGILGNLEKSLRDAVRPLKRTLRGAIRLAKSESLPLGGALRACDTDHP
jgi:hypothetical protein